MPSVVLKREVTLLIFALRLIKKYLGHVYVTVFILRNPTCKYRKMNLKFFLILKK